jgi:hypothetical protein
MLRYVDDFFSADKKGCVKHSLECFARVVRALMGKDALQSRKMDFGSHLVVLGVSTDIRADAIFLFPSKDKVAKWCAQLEQVRRKKQLFLSEAAKIAGRLSFASQYCFAKLGRSMLRPFFAQQNAPLPFGRCSKVLLFAINWWIHVLKASTQKQVSLTSADLPIVEMFCDARGSPPRVAAVLFMNGQPVRFTDMEPHSGLMQAFARRDDNQIMGLELLAILIGLYTFGYLLGGTVVRVWCDNVGGEQGLRAGTAKSDDHNMLIHGILLFAAKHDFTVWVERVPSKENIADEPSREEYSLLWKLGAVRTTARLPATAHIPKTWTRWA